MKISGGCYFGAIKRKSHVDIQSSIQCHFIECQHMTWGLPKVLMIVPLEKFNFVKGKPKTYKRKGIEMAMNRLL